METFGKYQIVRRLGQGGMADVYLAREPLAAGLSKVLVLKKIQPGLAEASHFRQMFEDEAKIGVLLNHPNIVQTFSYGQIGRTFYLAMERVEGVDLLRLIYAAADAGRRVPPGLAAYIVQQVCKGLDYAHRKADDFGEPLGIVHRDVSPQNILVSFDGAVKIVDFGIASVRGQKDDDQVVKGKFAYMSPEQAVAGRVDRRADIFSTGIVLYELATQRALFGRLGEQQAIEAIRRGLVPDPRAACPELPDELVEIIGTALQVDPAARYQTARDFQNALGRFFFQLGSREGEIYESGALAAFLAQVIPPAERAQVRAVLSSPPRTPVESPRAAPSRPEPATEVVIDPFRGVPGVEPTPVSNTPRQPTSVIGATPSPATPARGPRERKGVIVVEGLLGGLAALRRQAGEERSRGALLDFLRVAEHIAYKHRAVARRIDDRGFTYVLGLPATAEDDPPRALQLARRLDEALEGISRDLSPRLTLAIGVESGFAMASRGLAAGDARFDYDLLPPVDGVAQRLAGEAMPGEVLVGAPVFRATRGEWNFEELEPIDLDAGIEPAAATAGERARVYRLLGPRARAERMAAELDGPIGRELELQAIDETARDVVVRGAGRFLLVVGERGVGKRSLVASFRARLDPATHVVMRAVASATQREVPYALLADLLRDFLGVPDEADQRDLKRRVDGYVGQLFAPGDRRARPVGEAFLLLLGVKIARTEELDADERRHRLYQAIRLVGDQLAQHRTVVLLAEDLHFADQQSLAILHQLAREPLPRPVLILATARVYGRAAAGTPVSRRRPSGAGSGDPATSDPNEEEAGVERLLDEPQVTPIFLGELKQRAREAFVRERLQDPDLPDVTALGRAVLERAGGNPFYIQELLESLADRGILLPVADAAAAGSRRHAPKRYALVHPEIEIVVPPSLEAAVASRLERLDDDERATLRAAAVLGRRFLAADVAALTDRRGDAAVIDRLVERGLLAPLESGAGARDRFVFRSAITQEVAYAGIADEVRTELHRLAAARALASPRYHEGQDAAALARHLESAGDLLAAARAFGRAGRNAREVSGNLEAFRHFTRALDLLPEAPAVDDERFDLHDEREQILRALGRKGAQQREILAMKRLAEQLGDDRRLARAGARLAAFSLAAGKLAAARREIQRALETARAAGDEVTTAEALRLDSMLLTTIGSYAEALERIHAGLEALGARADRPARLERAETLNTLGNIQFDRGRAESAERAYTEALGIFRQLKSRRRESATLNNLGNVAIALGDFEQAITHYRSSYQLDDEMGDRAGIGATLGNLGQTWLRLGDLDRARRYLLRALELDETLGDKGGLTDATIAMGQVDLQRGDLDAAAERLERGLELAQSTRNRYQEIRALIYLAFCRVAAGETGSGEPARLREAPREPLREAPREALREAPREALRQAIDLARSAVKLAREADIPIGIAFGLAAEAHALTRAGDAREALRRSTEAVALLEQAPLDGSEELLLIHGRAARLAGERTVAETAVRRALAEVERKASRLRDEARTLQYRLSTVPREVQEEARALGIA